jgi:hypothetical protein
VPVRPTEIKLVAQMMDPDLSEESKVLAREIIEALDEARAEREQWVVAFRNHVLAPTIVMGPWSTKTQAIRAANAIAFQQDPNATPGVGYLATRLMGPNWVYSI